MEIGSHPKWFWIFHVLVYIYEWEVFFFPAGHCVSAIMLAYFVLGAYLCIISLFSSPHNSKRDTGSLLMPQQMVKVCSIIIMLHKSYRSLFSVWFSLKGPRKLNYPFLHMQMQGVLHLRMQLPMNEKSPLLFIWWGFLKDTTAKEWEFIICLLLYWGLDCYSYTNIGGGYFLLSARIKLVELFGYCRKETKTQHFISRRGSVFC